MAVQSRHKGYVSMAAVLALAFGTTGCGRLKDRTAIISDGYAVHDVEVVVNGETVACVVARGGSSSGGLAIDCDFN